MPLTELPNLTVGLFIRMAPLKVGDLICTLSLWTVTMGLVPAVTLSF